MEKFITVVGLFFINSEMAKYLGADVYGKIVFCASIFAVIQVIGWLGLQNVVYKNVSRTKFTGMRLSFSFDFFKKIAFYFSSILILFYLYNWSDHQVFYFSIIYFICSYFVVFDNYSIFNNATGDSKYNFYSNSIGFIFAYILRLLFVKLEFSYHYIGLTYIVFYGLPFGIRRFFHFARNGKILPVSNKKRVFEYFRRTGLLLLFSNLCIILYFQTNSFFLGRFVSYADLGKYAVVMLIAGSLNTIMHPILNAFFAKIFKRDRGCEEYIRKMHFYIFTGSFLYCVMVYFFGLDLIGYLFGKEYVIEKLLVILCSVGSCFAILGNAANRLILLNGGNKYILIKTIILTVFYIPIAYFLIKKIGLLGACIAYCILEFLGATVMNVFYGNGVVLKLQYSVFRVK